MMEENKKSDIFGIRKLESNLITFPIRFPVTTLVLLTILTRVIVFFQLEVISSDGMLYIQTAKLFSEGKYNEIYLPFILYPVLISLVQKVAGGWELSGRLISIVVSTATVIPIFLLGRRLYNERVAWVSALFYIFLPNVLRYSTDILRDPTAWFLMVLTLWLVWVGNEKGRPVFFGLASLSAGLGILTRPEGFVIWGALILYIAFCRREGLSLKMRVLNVALLGIVFPLLVIVFIVLVWNLSGRLELNALLGHLFFLVKTYTIMILNLPEPVRAIDEKAYGSLPIISESFRELVRSYKPVMVTSEVAYKLIKCANLLCIPIVFALWVRVKRGFNGADRFLLCVWAALLGMSLLYAWETQYFSTRHGLTLVFPGFFFASLGMIEIAERLSRVADHVSWRRVSIKKVFVPVLTSLVIFLFLIQVQDFSTARKNKTEMRIVGVWLKEQGFGGSVIMGPTRLSRLAFYAEGRFIEMPGSWEKAIESIRQIGVQIVVVDSCAIEKDCPDLKANLLRTGMAQLEGPRYEIGNCAVEIYKVR